MRYTDLEPEKTSCLRGECKSLAAWLEIPPTPQACYLSQNSMSPNVSCRVGACASRWFSDSVCETAKRGEEAEKNFELRLRGDYSTLERCAGVM